MQFGCHLIFHQRSSKLHGNFNNLNLIVFNGISNDIKIYENLKYNQFISIQICL
jgi:hypothetical protein